MLVRVCLLSCLLLLIAEFLPAQELTGTIQGRVTDIDDSPVPGVTITASSPSLIGGKAISYADENGRYRIPALAPGNYEVNAELPGFQSTINHNIRVFAGNTTTVDFTLEVSRVSENVIVTAETPTIDVSTTATSFTVPKEAVENLPRASDITALIALTPGVGDDLVAYGAPGEWANRYWFDGVDLSSPRSGGLLFHFNYNWLEELQVTGIGAPAEYGGFSGVVANFVTRSGGNDFHGLAEIFFENENLTSKNVPDSAPKPKLKTYDFSGQLGGPLMYDKLWFFSGFQYFSNDNQPFGYQGIRTDRFPKLITKLTYRANQNNTFQGFTYYGHESIDGDGAAFGVLPEATTIEKANETVWNATWISLLSSKTTFETRLGGLRGIAPGSARNDDLPGHIDSGTGIISVNAPVTGDGKRFRTQINASLSHYADNFLHGGHDFKFGVEIERSRVFQNILYSGGALYYDYYGASYLRYLWPGYQITNNNHRLSGYAEDNWNLSNELNVSAGVRWDHNRGISQAGNEFKTDAFAPRIGLVYNIKGKNQTVLKLHYGHYYDGLYEAFYRGLDPIPTAIAQVFDGKEWITLPGNIERRSSIDPNIRQPYIKQFIVGLDRQLPAGIAAGAHYIQRRWNNILEDISQSAVFEPVPFVNPVTGETIIVFNRIDHGIDERFLTNPRGLFRRYDGFEIFATRRFANGLFISGSFVVSRDHGNIQNSKENVFPFSPLLNDPNTTINGGGRLVNDPTIAWKIYGTYRLPGGFNAGWYFRHSSGDTWTPRVKLPRSLVSQGGRILGLPLGFNRLPSQNLLDFRIEKAFPISAGQLRLTADIFNLFNSGTVTSIEDRTEFPNFGMPTGFVLPREIRLGLRYSF